LNLPTKFPSENSSSFSFLSHGGDEWIISTLFVNCGDFNPKDFQMVWTELSSVFTESFALCPCGLCGLYSVQSLTLFFLKEWKVLQFTKWLLWPKGGKSLHN
jgi:hypothetical protein